MDKVESVQIDRSILVRMLDYGDVTILGTAEGFEALHTVASPIDLRNGITDPSSKPSVAGEAKTAMFRPMYREQPRGWHPRSAVRMGLAVWDITAMSWVVPPAVFEE